MFMLLRKYYSYALNWTIRSKYLNQFNAHLFLNLLDNNLNL